jgi:hypothetical protein
MPIIEADHLAFAILEEQFPVVIGFQRVGDDPRGGVLIQF